MKILVLTVLLMSTCVLLISCSPAKQAKKADKTAYDAIKLGQKAALGEERAFDVLYKPVTASPDAPDIIKFGDKNIRLNSPELTALTIAECLEIAFRNNRDFQNRREELFSTALEVANERRAWNWILFDSPLDAEGSHDKINKGAEDNLGAAEATARLTRRLVNGGVLTLAMSLNVATDFLGGAGTTAGSFLSANFTQPLLRGAWSGFAYEDQYRLERNFIYAVFEYERFKQTFAADIVTRFYIVLQQRDRMNNEATNVERLKKTVDLMEVLWGGGERKQVQFYQSQQNLINAKVRYETNVENYKNALDGFKIRLGLPVMASVKLDPKALEELAGRRPERLPFKDVNETVEVAFLVRPDLLTQRALVRDARRNIEIAANTFLPQLDLELDLSAAGTEPRKFHNVRFDRHRRFGGLVFNYNLDQTDNRDAYRNAMIDYARVRRDYEAFLDNVRLDVLRAYRSLEQSRASYKLQLENVGIGEKRQLLADEELGRTASARDVLEAKEALRNARNGLTSALVTYANTKLQFLATMGMLRVDEKGKIYKRAVPDTFKHITKRQNNKKMEK